MQSEEYPFDIEAPTLESSPIPSMSPRPLYTEDLRSGDHRLENKVADNILRLIFSHDHRLSARIATKGKLFPLSVPKEEAEALVEAAYDEQKLKEKFNHSPDHLKNFLQTDTT